MAGGKGGGGRYLRAIATNINGIITQHFMFAKFVYLKLHCLLD